MDAPITRRTLDRPTILALLADGRTTELIGVRETEEVDFKRDAYPLGTPKGRRDLVADVGAFANWQGGVIVVGVGITQDQLTDDEFAASIPGIKRGAMSVKSARALIRAHVHPLPRFEITVHELDPANSGPVVVAIDVHRQADERKPFLVSRLVDEDGKTQVDHAVGLPIRSGAVNHFESPEYIRSLIRGTQVAVDLGPGDRFAPGEPSDPGSPSAQASELDVFIEALSGRDEWADAPWYVLRAEPTGPRLVLEDFFGEFQRQSRSWSGYRGGQGFDLQLAWVPLRSAGNRLQAIGPRVGVQVSRLGEVLVAALGNNEFLCWASSTHDVGGLEVREINPYVLVEFTTEAFRFAFDYVGRSALGSTWKVSAHVRRFTQAPTLVLRGGKDFNGGCRDLHPAAPDDDDLGPFDTSATAGTTALSVLTEVYGQIFGLGIDDIPFRNGNEIDLGLLNEAAQRR